MYKFAIIFKCNAIVTEIEWLPCVSFLALPVSFWPFVFFSFVVIHGCEVGRMVAIETECCMFHGAGEGNPKTVDRR